MPPPYETWTSTKEDDPTGKGNRDLIYVIRDASGLTPGPTLRLRYLAFPAEAYELSATGEKGRNLGTVRWSIAGRKKKLTPRDNQSNTNTPTAYTIIHAFHTQFQDLKRTIPEEQRALEDILQAVTTKITTNRKP